MLPLPVSCVLWHVSGSGLVVAVAASEALAGRTTGLLGKRADGTIDPVRFTLLWPYHVGLRAKLALQRRFSSEPSFDQVTPDHYIGAWPSEQNLVPTVHPAVLDVTCELPLQLAPPAYLNLAVWDTHAPTPAQIDQGVQWAMQQRAAGRPILVHCAHGHGRSATVLGAILIAEGVAKGAADAEAVMKAERPRVRLNRRQRAALKQWVAEREGAKQEGGSGRKGGFQPHLDTMAEQDMEELPPALDSTDVLEMVLDKLKVNDLAAAAQVSRHWRAASLAADSAWRAAFEVGLAYSGLDQTQRAVDPSVSATPAWSLDSGGVW
ncbi:hypothetical protein CHLNCDRAFT_56882 [Chlorella variabilis]|uniref:Tyrosine specific protein phosphatases domain-containing protein n=1 Tax=Chlorella variabilis TaxID=554065 RepID=E1Z5L8_CHLVA|nr:hypothetical protein CHLNCDRAFT_56882 [Chlorella variabilis]EFN58779.1 hypothetical protein CHLNCDRAFT_56882 [Chlorella variabilis]|eukprot:XP_005850881.1 hypothetical protein CHLNCDRAFT_56882 [Chlorella variabilis]